MGNFQPFYGLAAIVVAHTTGKNGQFRFFRAGVIIKGAVDKWILESIQPQVGLGMETTRRDETALSGKFGNFSLTSDGSQRYGCPCMTDSGGLSHDDREPRFLRNFKGPTQHIPGIFRAGGLQKGYMGRRGQIPGILFLNT